MLRLEMVIRANKRTEIRDRLRDFIDPLPRRKAAVMKILLGGDSTFTSPMVLNADGSGPTIAYALGSWVTNEELNFLRDIRNELTQSQKADTQVRAFDPEQNTVSFWEWVAAFPTPLYRKAPDPEPQP
jgi:hypothetical protein